MSFFDKFRRQKEDPEVARRALLIRSGRIGEATILDSDVDADGQTRLSYCYSVGGVDYETVQHLDAEQLTRKDYYLPGSRVDIRYDPRRPANSMVV